MFLGNCWYVAGWSHHFPSDHPVPRTMPGEPIVLYRARTWHCSNALGRGIPT